jgi:hypothetical protein
MLVLVIGTVALVLLAIPGAVANTLAIRDRQNKPL